MPRIAVLFSLCVLTVSAAGSTGSQQSAERAAEDEAWHFETAAPEIRARRDGILAEIAAGKAGEWAGWYIAYPGETTSTGLLWAPESGYLLYLAPDGPWPEDVSYGRVELSGGVLRLSPEVPVAKRRWSFNTFFNEFRCVRWGSSRYLVPPDRLAQFCDAVASGDTREVGLFLGTRSGSDWPPAGQPEVPAEYRTYLNAKPIVARVRSVLGTSKPGGYVNETRIVLSAGSADGIRTDMKFWLDEPRVRTRGDFALEIRVESVRKHTSEAVAEAIPVSEVTGEPVFPKIGWKFRNRLPK